MSKAHGDYIINGEPMSFENGVRIDSKPPVAKAPSRHGWYVIDNKLVKFRHGQQMVMHFPAAVPMPKETGVPIAK
jgi:hypothetical protein